MLVKTLIPAIAIVMAATTGAFAQSPSRMNQFEAWGAYSYDSDNGKVCYVLSVPTQSRPTEVNHGDNFFLVSRRSASSYEPQAMMGYQLREGSKVTVTIDGEPFEFFTRGTSAWVEDTAREPALVGAMRAGASMTIEATSARGTSTSYTYSLSGVTAALDAIENCQ